MRVHVVSYWSANKCTNFYISSLIPITYILLSLGKNKKNPKFWLLWLLWFKTTENRAESSRLEGLEKQSFWLNGRCFWPNVKGTETSGVLGQPSCTPECSYSWCPLHTTVYSPSLANLPWEPLGYSWALTPSKVKRQKKKKKIKCWKSWSSLLN